MRKPVVGNTIPRRAVRVATKMKMALVPTPATLPLSAFSQVLSPIVRRYASTVARTPGVLNPYSLAGAFAREAAVRATGSLGQDVMRSIRRVARSPRWRRSGGRLRRRTPIRSPRRRTPRNPNIGPRARTRVGERVGTSNCRRVQNVAVDRSSNSTKTFYSTALLGLALGDNIDQRPRDIANMRGIKLALKFENLVETDSMHVNVAVITRKDCTSTTTTPLTEDFWRDPLGSSRGINWSTAHNALDMHTNMINTDRFLVHWHKRFTLGAPGSSDAMRPYYRIIEKYIPIKRQLRYDSSTTPGTVTQPINTNMWLVWYYSCCQDTIADTPQASAVATQQKGVMYFRDTRT